MIFLQRKIFYYYKEQLSVYFQYVALFGFEQEGILIGFMRIAEGNLEMLFIINLKIYDEQKYQKLEHDFRLMSVPQRKKHKNIFFLFLLTTILVILVDIMLLYSYNSHMNNLT